MVLLELIANQIRNLAWMATSGQQRNGQPAYASRLKKKVIWVLEYVLDARWEIGRHYVSWQFALSREWCGAKKLVKPRQKRVLIPFDKICGGCRSVWDSDRCLAGQSDDALNVPHCR